MPKNFVEMVKEIINLLRHNPNLILYGPPGTGKTYTAKAVAYYLILGKELTSEDLRKDEWQKELIKYEFGSKHTKENKGQWAIIQFHPAYNYDDLVRGIEVKTKKGEITYETVWRIIGEMSRMALVSLVAKVKGDFELSGNEEEDYKNALEIWNNELFKEWKENRHAEKFKDMPAFVLIIDEINRANLPAVFGELIYALEYRGEPVKTLYGGELVIPPNLYIIGTMNTADRSAKRIDYAIRRRFTFYPMHADLSYAEKPYGHLLMDTVNGFIENNISPEYDPEDIKIGHTYFMSKAKNDDEKMREIAYKFLYQVVPLLYEYIQDGLITPKESFKKDNVSIHVENGKIELEIKKEERWELKSGKLVKENRTVSVVEFKAALTGHYPLPLALYELLKKAVQVKAKDEKDLYEGIKESVIQNLTGCKEDENCIERFYKALEIFESLKDKDKDKFDIKTGETQKAYIENMEINFRIKENEGNEGEHLLIAGATVEKKENGKKKTEKVESQIKNTKDLKDFLQKVRKQNNSENNENDRTGTQD